MLQIPDIALFYCWHNFGKPSWCFAYHHCHLRLCSCGKYHLNFLPSFSCWDWAGNL